MRTDILTVGELGAYWRAHTRAALAYYKANGSPAVARLDQCETPASLATRRAEHSRDWHAAHDATLERKATRAGESAVRKIYRDRVKMRDTYAALSIRDAAHLDTLERAAAAAVARLAELEPAAPRKSTRATVVAATAAPAPVKLRKGSKLEPCTRHAAHWQSLAPADRFRHACEGGTSTACEGGACLLTPGTDRFSADFVAAGPVTLAELNGYASREPVAELEPAPAAELEPVADVVPLRPDVDTTPAPAPAPAPAPDTVPAPMPAMTRAARKATRRELAAAMRAEGLRPEGEEWRRRCAAAGLPVPAAEVSR